MQPYDMEGSYDDQANRKIQLVILRSLIPLACGRLRFIDGRTPLRYVALWIAVVSGSWEHGPAHIVLMLASAPPTIIIRLAAQFVVNTFRSYG